MLTGRNIYIQVLSITLNTKKLTPNLMLYGKPIIIPKGIIFFPKKEEELVSLFLNHVIY